MMAGRNRDSLRRMHRILVLLLTAAVAACGIGLLSAGLATNYWLQARVFRDISSVIRNGSDFAGSMHVGLFSGCKMFNYAFGLREKCFSVTGAEVGTNITYQPGHPMVAATIAFNAGAMLMGLVAVIFSAYNVYTNPIETFAGPLGLYIWNGVSAVFCLVCLILYAVLYLLHLSGNDLLPQSDLDSRFYVATSGFGYSYWLVLGALAAFLLNEGLVYLSGKHIRSVFQNRSGSMKERPSEDVLMY
ncbi:PREDICTED: clarin-3-like isoform X1 [Branchiostoma belcheri]|uniref:Clarin-3-like isoform X1 n=1 Tax=Branchiostoma belcheri TaxID=7741 RepID=A0A6P4ZF03_BRABE|nr:PREDICTED: clarin-3-like isoform X1 [Branchiostoma belcheri]